MTEVQTPVKKLPSWKGRPVPWVARWSGEQLDEPAQVAYTPEGDLFIYYADGREFRDEHGLLWIRENVDRAGTPEYAQVSATRQRNSMLHRLCQVCGDEIQEPVIRWLIDPRQIRNGAEGETITYSPPTCDGCVQLSLTLCPAMKKSHVVVRVLEYEVWGVSASVIRIHEGRAQESKEGMIRYGKTGYPFGMHQVVARQQIVEWTKFRVED